MKRSDLKAGLFLVLLLPGLVFAQNDIWDDEDWGDEEDRRWTGFAEAALGGRFNSDPLLDANNTLEDLRWRLESSWQPGQTTVAFKADAAYDGVTESFEGDIRELTAAFSLGENLDVKLGRQVQTWGTGDLVFLNDLFPKDFQSFFAGRDDEYLKAPGNALRMTWFTSVVNVDFAWTPKFEPDLYLNGERFSFYSPIVGDNVAPRPPLDAVEPESTLANGELALRAFKNVKGREFAVYLYDGFFKQPTALTEDFEPTFAPMVAFGASLRQSLGRGLFNAEASWYQSRDDRDGSDPLIPNDQLRVLLGYEWEARPNFTVGVQYYLEKTLDYDALIDNSPFPGLEPDEHRHLLTNRLTYRVGRDRHTWSLFTFYSPSDDDFYVRPAYTYRHDDHWSIAAGANLFDGDKPQTFFSQLQDASNAYLRVRYIY